MSSKLSQAPNAELGLAGALGAGSRMYAYDPTIAAPQSVAIPAANLLASLSMTALGDLAYGGAGGKVTFLAGNISAVRKLLFSQGTGLAAQAPFFATLQTGDMPSTWFNQPVTTASSPTFSGLIITTGTIGINTATPWSKLDIVFANGSLNNDLRTRGIVSEYYGVGAFGGKGGISMVAGGTFASPATVAVNDLSGLTQPLFYDGSIWRVGATINAIVSGVVAATNIATELQFLTGTVTGNATLGQFTGLSEKMRLDKNGNLLVGINAPIAAALLSVNGSIATSAPVTGTSGAWKLGIYVAGAAAATGVVQLDIGGTLYKLLAST